MTKKVKWCNPKDVVGKRLVKHADLYCPNLYALLFEDQHIVVFGAECEYHEDTVPVCKTILPENEKEVVLHALGLMSDDVLQARRQERDKDNRARHRERQRQEYERLKAQFESNDAPGKTP